MFENVILNEVKNLGGEKILQSLRSFRMTQNHYRMAWGIQGGGLPKIGGYHA